MNTTACTATVCDYPKGGYVECDHVAPDADDPENWDVYEGYFFLDEDNHTHYKESTYLPFCEKCGEWIPTMDSRTEVENKTEPHEYDADGICACGWYKDGGFAPEGSDCRHANISTDSYNYRGIGTYFKQRDAERHLCIGAAIGVDLVCEDCQEYLGWYSYFDPDFTWLSAHDFAEDAENTNGLRRLRLHDHLRAREHDVGRAADRECQHAHRHRKRHARVPRQRLCAVRVPRTAARIARRITNSICGKRPTRIMTSTASAMTAAPRPARASMRTSPSSAGRRPTTLWEIVDEVLHNIYTVYDPVIRCEDCGEEFVDDYNDYANSKDEDIYEMHTYDAGNMCTVCGYTTDCTHENADIKRTPVDSWSSWNDDSTHTVYEQTLIEVVCTLDRVFRTMESYENVSEEEAHAYDEDFYCPDCEHYCEHSGATTEVTFEATGYDDAAATDKAHVVTGVEITATTCPHCGKVEKAEAEKTAEEAHAYEVGEDGTAVCAECDYTCTHASSTVREVFVVDAYTSNGASGHTVKGDTHLVERCDGCGAVFTDVGAPRASPTTNRTRCAMASARSAAM